MGGETSRQKRAAFVLDTIRRWPNVAFEAWSNGRRVHLTARLPQYAGPDSPTPAFALCGARGDITWVQVHAATTCGACERAKHTALKVPTVGGASDSSPKLAGSTP